MASTEALVSGDLTIEPRLDAAEEACELFFRGRSNERHPARSVVPYVSEALVRAAKSGRSMRLHFETIDHMNSSTITAIIQIIQEARTQAVPLEIVFDCTKNWQKLSFEALGVFAKEDGLLKLVAVRP